MGPVAAFRVALPPAYDRPLTSAVLNVFIRALFGELRRRAGDLLGLRFAQCGAVTFIHSFGDALNANVHFHSMVIDGVYAADDDGRPWFHPLPAPDDEDGLRLTVLIARRTHSLLERRGLGSEANPPEADPPSEADPGMAALVASSVSRRIAVGSNAGRGVVRMGDQIDPESMDAFQSPRSARVSGFSVHANISVEARDRTRLERLLRYAARPAVATDRLSELPDGRLHYRLKRAWRDGTIAVVFERQDFIAKLAVLVPAPRAHLTRYHGVLGLAAAWRSRIVPAGNLRTGESERKPQIYLSSTWIGAMVRVRRTGRATGQAAAVGGSMGMRVLALLYAGIVFSTVVLVGTGRATLEALQRIAEQVAELEAPEWPERAQAMRELLTRERPELSAEVISSLVRLLARENEFRDMMYQEYVRTGGAYEGEGESYGEYYDELAQVIFDNADFSDPDNLRVFAQASFSPESAWAQRLAMQGDEIVPLMLEPSEAANPSKRESAIGVLATALAGDGFAESDAETVRSRVRAGLADGNYAVRVTAAKGLGLVGESVDVDVLAGIAAEEPEGTPLVESAREGIERIRARQGEP